ncbi:MAG: Ig-like domain-containing protein, partial [Parabacteroides sp.]|nr:Ig-like domain-containing protein [Parabacteroides sp.]
EITPTEVTLTVGETAVLSATVFPTDADNPAVTWSTSDETVVTVQEGLITAVAPGTAVIKVTTVDGNYTASCLVTVEKDATGIEGISTGIKVYPTVTTDNVNIELATPKTVYLIDLSGKVRAIVPCTSGTNVISLHAYPAGIYFIRIDNGVTKVVKR